MWYLFGLAAIILIFLRVKSTRRETLRDPMALTFTLCLLLPAFGTLSKQPFIAEFVDSIFGANTAWLIADILFITGVCIGTYWIEMLSQPDLRKEGWRLLLRWRVAALVAVAAWMIIAAWLEAPTWATLERGGIDVDGSWILLSGRMAYFGYSLWSLTYLSYGFYLRRRDMQNRNIYIRMTLPWLAISLAIAAPALQIAGVWLVFIQPESLPSVWSTVWGMVTAIQVAAAILILSTFIKPAYQFVIWLDKQILVHRLLRIYMAIRRARPDILPKTPALGRPGLIVRDPDLWLATLVGEIESAKTSIGTPADKVQVPAGGSMPEIARKILREERNQFLRGLANEPVTTYQTEGDFYALARWYAAVL